MWLGVNYFAGLHSGTAAGDSLVVGTVSVLREWVCCLVLHHCLPWDSNVAVGVDACAMIVPGM